METTKKSQEKRVILYKTRESRGESGRDRERQGETGRDKEIYESPNNNCKFDITILFLFFFFSFLSGNRKSLHENIIILLSIV